MHGQRNIERFSDDVAPKHSKLPREEFDQTHMTPFVKLKGQLADRMKTYGDKTLQPFDEAWGEKTVDHVELIKTSTMEVFFKWHSHGNCQKAIVEPKAVGIAWSSQRLRSRAPLMDRHFPLCVHEDRNHLQLRELVINGKAHGVHLSSHLA